MKKKEIPYAGIESMTRTMFEADLESRGLLNAATKAKIAKKIGSESKITAIQARQILKTAEQRDLSRGSYRF